jgi:hypothetical protein
MPMVRLRPTPLICFTWQRIGGAAPTVLHA